MEPSRYLQKRLLHAQKQHLEFTPGCCNFNGKLRNCSLEQDVLSAFSASKSGRAARTTALKDNARTFDDDGYMCARTISPVKKGEELMVCYNNFDSAAELHVSQVVLVL